MAEARAVSSLGGYDDEFVNAVEEDWQCAICQLPLKDPILTQCGHRFCRQCLDEHFRRCSSEGCQWTGELRSKDNHLASCPLKVVSCTNKNCNVTLTRNKLQKHVTSTCQWRIIRCTHCRASHAECKTEVHQNECKRFPLNCLQKCGAFIPREEILIHTENNCPLTIISCPYAQMGCTTKILRKEVEDHLQSTVRLHLDLACVKLNNTQKEFKETIRKLEEKINALENREMQIFEEHIYNWKINNFSQVLTRAKSGETPEVDSAPFYRYGYKCRLNLNPNGNGSGKNTHLSIFLIIMKGECDAILPWPFHKNVTVTLIDQQENPDDRENIVVSYTTDPTQSSYVRPVTDENNGWGHPKFVSHSKLTKRRFIGDDTIFIQLKISPPL